MNIDRVRIKKKQNDFYRNQSTIFETSDTGHALSRHEEAQRRREVCSIGGTTLDCIISLVDTY